MKLPKVFTEAFSEQTRKFLELEAAKLFRIHQLPSTLDQWQQHRKLLRNQIAEHAGMEAMDHNLPLDMQVTGEIQLNGYKIRKILFQSRKDFYVTGTLYLPDSRKKMPGVLGVHGHWSQGKVAQRVQERGHTLASSGYVFLQIDAFGSGERCTEHGNYEYHGGTLGGSLMAIGRTLMGMQIHDCMRAIDLLCSLDCVDPDKIGVTGASGGGNQTMWIAAMDERVKAAVPVVSVGTFESYIKSCNCVCELLPGGLTFCEESGVLALMAPKALKICNCLGDQNQAFYPAEMIRSYTEARKVFQLYDADDKLAYQVFNRPHGYWPEIRETMLGWFDLHLKGIGHGAPRKENDYKVLEEDELLVFEKGKRHSSVPGIGEYCRSEARKIKKSFASAASISRTEKCEQLRELIGLGNAQAVKDIHDYGCQGVWQKLALETVEGKLLPLLIRKGTGAVRVLAHPVRKEDLEHHRMLQDALAGDDTLIVADLTGSGEIGSYDPKLEKVPYHDLARWELWLGRTMIGEWVNDLLLIAKFAQGQYPQQPLALSACGETAVAALIASALENPAEKVYAYDLPLSYEFNKSKPSYSLAVMLPGIINWGDIVLAAAISDSSLKLIDPSRIDGEKVTDGELDEFHAQREQLKKRLN